MAFIYVTGDHELNRRIQNLKTSAAARASKNAVTAGARLIARKARRAAPVGKDTVMRRRANPAKRLKLTIRVKPEKRKGVGVYGVKVTVSAPHGHLVTLGTRPRTRKRIGGKFAWHGPGPDPRNKGTGAAKPNPFFRRTHQSLGPEVKRTMLERMKFEVVKEFQKGNRA